MYVEASFSNMRLLPRVKFALKGEVWPQGWSLPLRVILATRGELWSLGVNIVPFVHPRRDKQGF
jgi:hypothetical protein